MSGYDRDFQCREIISRAVCGSGKKFAQVVHHVSTPQKPSTILGAWVINHQYEAKRSEEGVDVIGSYDMNIWYSFHGNSQTEVAKESVHYTEHVPLFDLDEQHLSHTASVYAECVQHPSCVEAVIDEQHGGVQITVEREFVAELVAETKLCVVICPGDCGNHDKADDAELYDDLDDELFVDEDEPV